MYSLRVMVFVEYEAEVEEERGRVEALLEKLRISAEVHVFWLASGDLVTYEAIIQGESDEPTEQLVDDVMKGSPWWQSIKEIRGKTPLDATDASAAGPSASRGWKGAAVRRRPSLPHIEELQKHQTVSALARLGLSMGIRTQKLAGRLSTGLRYHGDEIEYSSDSDSNSTSDEGDFAVDFNDVESAASEGDLEDLDEADASRRPLLETPIRRKSHGDAIIKRPTLRRKKTEEPKHAKQSSISSTAPSSLMPAFTASFSSASGQGYGTISNAPSSSTSEQSGETASRRLQDSAFLTAQGGCK